MALSLIRQRDGTTFQKSNCGCVATAHALAWSTGNKVRRTPDQCRRALGGIWVGTSHQPPDNSTALADQKRAWQAFRPAARRRGLRLPAFDIRLKQPWEDVIAALEAGNAVMLQIDNATLNEKAIQLSGFPGFSGLHVVLLTELRRRPDGDDVILDYDGGYDGRFEAGIKVRRGPQWVAATVLKEAAEEKNVISLRAGGMTLSAAKKDAKGTATFAVIAPATPIKDKPDDPDPDPVTDPGGDGDGGVVPVVDVVDPGLEEEQDDVPDPDGATVAELRASLKRIKRRLAEARAANERLVDQNEILETALGVIQTILADAQPDDQAVTAASEEIDRTLPPTPPGDDIPDIGVGDEL